MKKILTLALISSAIIWSTFSTTSAQLNNAPVLFAHVHFVDKDDNGNIIFDDTIEKNSRIYWYYYNTVPSGGLQNFIGNESFYLEIPTHMCMTAEWLPVFLPTKITGTHTIGSTTFKITKEDLIESTLIRDHKNLNNIERIENRWLQTVYISHDTKELYTLKDIKSPFHYSTDNGTTWVPYTSRNDDSIPNDCSITNVKYQSDTLWSTPNIITYNMTATSDEVNTLIRPSEENGYTVGTKNINIAAVCEELPIHVSVTKKQEEEKPKEEKPKPVEPAPKPTNPQPQPSAPTTSGPGGYITDRPTIPATPTETLVVESKKAEEKKDFSMSFSEVKEEILEILPTVTPKMGTTFTNPTAKSWMEKLKLIETRLPTRDLRLAGSEDINIEFWKQVLPEVDKNRDEYIVIPSRGLVIPVTHVDENSTSYQSFISGNNEDFVKESYNGSVMMPGGEKREYGEVGNKVIGGHSSWWRNTDNRYKTHFQTLINLETGTEIWTYKKNDSGDYIRYVYKTTESYNTSDTDVSILKNTPEKSLLTLFTCTPIGGDVGRWVVKAEFMGKY